jgi:opacity protein-like surface antigen
MAIKTVLGLALAFGLTVPAQAAVMVAPVGIANAPVIEVYGGCGPYGHRGPWGGCRPGGQGGGYGWGRACPFGFHLGPYGRRCWPN